MKIFDILSILSDHKIDLGQLNGTKAESRLSLRQAAELEKQADRTSTSLPLHSTLSNILSATVW